MGNSYYFSTQGTGLTFLVSPLLPAGIARSLVNCGLVLTDVPFRNACMVSSPGYKTKEKEKRNNCEQVLRERVPNLVQRHSTTA